MMVKARRKIINPGSEVEEINRTKAAITVGAILGAAGVIKYFKGQIGSTQIESALATIKASSLHLALMTKVHDRIMSEQHPAEVYARAAKMIAALDPATKTIPEGKPILRCSFPRSLCA